MRLKQAWRLSIALCTATFVTGYAAIFSLGDAGFLWNLLYWLSCTAFFVCGTVLLIKYHSKSLSDQGMTPITLSAACLGIVVSSPVGLRTFGLSVIYPISAAIVALAMMTAVRLYKRG